MDSSVLYNVKQIPFAERETFNNAILLLSMVKSEFYYIVGFSRPDNIIEIGFDLSGEHIGLCFETLILDFSADEYRLKVFSKLKNVVFENEAEIPFEHDGYFTLTDGGIYYERLFEKDNVIPMSMDKLNTIILSVKRDIEQFEENGFAYILKKGLQDRL